MDVSIKDLSIKDLSIKDLSIKDLRFATGLSQSQFAYAYHIPVKNIQNWEQGTRKPPSYIIYLLFRCVQFDFPNAFNKNTSKENNS